MQNFKFIGAVVSEFITQYGSTVYIGIAMGGPAL